MPAPDAAGLRDRALGWIARLPLLADLELALLLGVHEQDARRCRRELGERGWIEWVMPACGGLDGARRCAILRPDAVSALAAALGRSPREVAAGLPAGRGAALDRIGRFELTARTNALLAALAAGCRERRGMELADARSLPLAVPRAERWWLPDSEAYACLRAGRLWAPCFVAWDHPAAPDAHRRRRVGLWGAARERIDRAWRGAGLPPLVIVAAGERELGAWEAALLAQRERTGRRLAALLATAEEVWRHGPHGDVWRVPGRPEAKPLAERLYWGEDAPPCPAPRVPADLTAEAVDQRTAPLRTLAPGAAARPEGIPARDWGAAVTLQAGAGEQELLRWLALQPLLSAGELAALTSLAEPLVVKRLGRLARCGAVQGDRGLCTDEASEPRFALTRRGLRFLASQAGVPERRFEREGGFVVPEPSSEAPEILAVRHRAHALGVNRVLARLVADVRKEGWGLRWRNERQSAHRFLDGGRPAWVRPDGSGEFAADEAVWPFLFEYDRGTLDGGDLARKFERYRRYFAREAWRERFASEPSLLVVCADDRAERRVARAAVHVADGCPVLLTAVWRLQRDGGNEAGLRGLIWRGRSCTGCRPCRPLGADVGAVTWVVSGACARGLPPTRCMPGAVRARPRRPPGAPSWLVSRRRWIRRACFRRMSVADGRRRLAKPTSRDSPCGPRRRGGVAGTAEVGGDAGSLRWAERGTLGRAATDPGSADECRGPRARAVRRGP